MTHKKLSSKNSRHTVAIFVKIITFTDTINVSKLSVHRLLKQHKSTSFPLQLCTKQIWLISLFHTVIDFTIFSAYFTFYTNDLTTWAVDLTFCTTDFAS